MKRIFLSYAARDQRAVDAFCDFLVLGMGVARGDLFCAAQQGTLTVGASFPAQIRQALADCRRVICFLTPSYLQSVNCMLELGAAWLQTGKLVPLLVEPLEFSAFDGTLLRELQMLCHAREDGLAGLYQLLCDDGLADAGLSAEFPARLRRYLDGLQRPRLAVADAAGYYEAQVRQVRPTPPAYRCYGLDGLLQLPDAPAPLPDETHWLFYRAGMYPDLAVGDVVRFSVESTELRDFNDLKHARNIYPRDLREAFRPSADR